MPDIIPDETLRVGVIQTTIDASRAWLPGDAPTMSAEQDEHAWKEICKAMRSFYDYEYELRPRLIVLPELSLPRTRIEDFEHLVAALNVIAVTGVDYKLDHATNTARNEGLLFVPSGFYRSKPSRYCTRILFGKTYGSPKEIDKLKELNPPWSFGQDFSVYVFDCGSYGTVGVSICYDFMDVERALMYRGQIQHLLVLAYNRDLKMFRALADALSRTVFCNVVVCNTGYFGGSLVVSPYRKAISRTLYSHEGGGLFTTQVVPLPVRDLVWAQRGEDDKLNKPRNDRLFKDPPPGYKEMGQLSLQQIKL
jgi:predicted amidohydrolase